jgi:hypothetical protein
MGELCKRKGNVTSGVCQPSSAACRLSVYSGQMKADLFKQNAVYEE